MVIDSSARGKVSLQKEHLKHFEEYIIQSKGLARASEVSFIFRLVFLNSWCVTLKKLIKSTNPSWIDSSRVWGPGQPGQRPDRTASCRQAARRPDQNKDQESTLAFQTPFRSRPPGFGGHCWDVSPRLSFRIT